MMKSAFLSAAAILLVCNCCFAYDWSSNPGDGSEDNPFQISTAEQLMSIGSDEELLSKHFLLMNDISFDPDNNPEHVFDKALIAPYVYGKNSRFTGKFDGGHNRIINLRIDAASKDYIGLFGLAGPNGHITGVGLENAEIQGRDYVGGIAGFSTQFSISDCYVKGGISGANRVGGIIGEANVSSVNTSYFSGSVLGSRYTGGIVGFMASEINDCYVSGEVRGTNYYAGGIVGRGAGEINRCYVTCKVPNTNTGAICGSATSAIAGTAVGCFWDIEISGVGAKPGKFGRGLTTAEMTTMNTYSLNGWAGSAWTIKEGEYPRLTWEKQEGTPISEPVIVLDGDGTESVPYEITDADDFMLVNENIYFWDKQLILKSDIDLKGYSIDCIGSRHAGAFSGIFDGNGHSIDNAAIDVLGPTCVGLFAYVNFGEIRNLNVKDITVKPAYLTGGLVGYNVEGFIYNCSVSGEIYGNQSQTATIGGLGVGTGGLVGNNKNSRIENCDTNCKVSARASAGGLVGSNSSSIILNSFSDSEVDGHMRTGGFVGASTRSTIKYCYANSIVESGGQIGCFVGFSSSEEIECCYSTGHISGYSYGIGGFAGYTSSSSIKKCYSTASVNSSSSYSVGGFIGDRSGSVEASFWDVDTSGMTSSDAGLGKSTEQMQSSVTFLEAGWDFAGEDVNGSDDTWFMRDGIEYPRLAALNRGPVADAGAGQVVNAWIDGFAGVKLDGTGSADSDGDELEYSWYNEDNDLIAEGCEPDVVLGVGEHVVSLIVNDGLEESEPNRCVVTVIEALETAVKLMPKTINLSSKRKLVIGWIEVSDEQEPAMDPNQPMLLLAGDSQVEAYRQMTVYSEEEGKWYTAGFFDIAGVAGNLNPGSDAEITIVHRFESGQWVYGEGAVRVQRDKRAVKGSLGK